MKPLTNPYSKECHYNIMDLWKFYFITGLFIITLFVNLVIVEANPIPVPLPASMPLEDMYSYLDETGRGNLHEIFIGNYYFDYIPKRISMMKYPLPPKSNGIGAVMGKLDDNWNFNLASFPYIHEMQLEMDPMEWFSIGELYPTVLPEWPGIPMIAWNGPFPKKAVFSVKYKHNLLRRADEYIYFYALGTGKAFSTYQKEAVAFLDITMPIHHDMYKLFLDMTPHAFAETIEKDESGYEQRIVSIYASAYFRPFVRDIIGHIRQGEGSVAASHIRFSYTVEECGTTEPPGIIADVIPQDNKMVVTDQIYFNCCPEYVRMTILMNANNVIFYEKAIEEAPCDCDCYYPMEGEAGPFPPGTYHVELISPFNETILTKEIVIEEYDTDKDGIPDHLDNCPTIANPEQIDTDQDGDGDVCDSDDDNDGLPDEFEKTMTNTNPLLTDSDDDGILDGDEDPDNDGYTNLEEYYGGWNPLNPDDPSAQACLFSSIISGTGIYLGLDYVNMSDAIIGIDESSNQIPVPTPPPFYTVFMKIKDLSQELGYNYMDIREKGNEREKWLLNIDVPDGIKETYPETWYPLISWYPDELCPQGYFRLYSSNSSGDLVALRISDMRETNTYQMQETDNEYLCIVWSRVMSVDLVLDGGWNMISLPVIPLDLRAGSIFPNATAMFKFNTTYKVLDPNDALEPGVGYWLHVPEPTTCTITGTPFSNYTADLPAGWSMIGSCTDPSFVSLETGSIRALFGFDRKYVLIGYGNHIGPLPPGKGFWINLSEPATISVSAK